MTNSSRDSSSLRGSLPDGLFDVTGSGSPTGPKMIDAGKTAAVEGVETSAIVQARIEEGQAQRRPFTLIVVRERYLRCGTTAKHMGSPEYTELLELCYKDRVDDANIASAAKTSARQHFGGGLRRNDRDLDGGGINRNNFKNVRLARETAPP
eukprot:jgi/Tetstr1/420380/TSEL_011496.t1